MHLTRANGCHKSYDIRKAPRCNRWPNKTRTLRTRMDTMASTKTRLGSLILIKVPTEVGGGSASIVKRCHGCATNQFRGKSIIFQSFVLAKNSGNASILVYIVPEPKNHCVVPTICLGCGGWISLLIIDSQKARGSIAESSPVTSWHNCSRKRRWLNWLHSLTKAWDFQSRCREVER